MSKTIYFDESGYTGNNLLHQHQSFFSYASIAINHNDALELVVDLKKRYNVQGDELKGKNLIKHEKGKRLITEIVELHHQTIKISISEKKYALACKFFEYVFEPCISDISSIFHEVGFHEFIAAVLFTELKNNNQSAEYILAKFEEVMRNKDLTQLELIFSEKNNNTKSEFLHQIMEFASNSINQIHDEIDSLKNISLGNWILDLTNTSLYSLLCSWGEDFEQMTAICDNSAPLIQTQDSNSIFNQMVGETRKIQDSFFKSGRSMTFNLKEPIQFRNSKETPGIQLADTIAAAAVYMFQNPVDPWTTRWGRLLIKNMAHNSIIPGNIQISKINPQTRRNIDILRELYIRSKNGSSYTEGMSEFIRFWPISKIHHFNQNHTI